MRVDKFLKLTRLVKRRSVANTLCDAGRVSIDGKVVKASATVAVGQQLLLRFGNRRVQATVLALPSVALANQQQAQAYVQTQVLPPAGEDPSVLPTEALGGELPEAYK
jgi:ribosomal 50S subunit-recycling heat shock protein